MKKCTAVLMAFLLCLLCACSPAEEEFNCVYYAPLEFSSVEAMIEFLRAEETDSMERLGYHTSEVKSMEVPNEEAFAAAFDAELKSVSLSENGVHYLFSLSHVDVNALAETYRFEDRMSSLSAEEQQLRMELFTEISREILITCGVKSEDGTTLAGAASGGQVKHWEEHPGFSYAEANFGDIGEGEPYGYYLYWNDFGNSFFARMPAHLVDSFFENYDSLIETVTVRE